MLSLFLKWIQNLYLHIELHDIFSCYLLRSFRGWATLKYSFQKIFIYFESPISFSVLKILFHCILASGGIIKMSDCKRFQFLYICNDVIFWSWVIKMCHRFLNFTITYQHEVFNTYSANCENFLSTLFFHEFWKECYFLKNISPPMYLHCFPLGILDSNVAILVRWASAIVLASCMGTDLSPRFLVQLPAYDLGE